MRLMWIVAFLLLSLRPGIAAQDTAPAPAPDPAAPTPRAAAPDLSIADALDAISDEDKPTREKALARLARATVDDLPALEKSADSTDPEIHKQVALLLKRLKRGQLALLLKYPDGTPAANLKIAVKAYAGEIRIARGGRGNQMLPGNLGPGVSELAAGDYTTDAAGKIAIGQYNDGLYTLLIATSDPLPAQSLNGQVNLSQQAPPLALEIRRGVSGPVTTVDEDGKPVADATLFYLTDLSVLNQYRNIPVSQALQSGQMFSCGTTDEKGAAEIKLVGAGRIIVAALKEGYDLAAEDDIKAADGAKINLNFKLIKTKPIQLSIVCKNRQGELLKTHRILLLRPKDLMKVMGNQWFNSADAKKIPTYIENGAIDLDSSDDAGCVSHQLMPDVYWVFAFGKDGKTYYSTVNDATKTGTVTALFNEMVKAGR